METRDFGEQGNLQLRLGFLGQSILGDSLKGLFDVDGLLG